MRRFFAAVLAVAFIAPGLARVTEAAICPDDVAAAKAALNEGAQGQAPKSLAGGRSKPRGYGRGDQEMQAPGGQETQAPRSLAGAKSPSGASAAKLIAEAEAACKAGDSATAAKKLEALKIQK